jgi:hypothetical protein
MKSLTDAIVSHIESSAIPLIFGTILILVACVDLRELRGSGFLSANA